MFFFLVISTLSLNFDAFLALLLFDFLLLVADSLRKGVPTEGVKLGVFSGGFECKSICEISMLIFLFD